MSGDPVRLVCFDLGGVVVRICRSWEEGCAAAGIPVREAAQRPSTATRRNEIIVQYQTGRIDGPAFAARISEVLDGVYSPAEIMAVHHAWMVGEYAGVAALVDRLHDHGLETGVLSNTNHEHWTVLDRVEAFGRLRNRHASHLLGLHKPDPAIYRAFESEVGHAGSAILFFDDLPENVEAARRLGWRAEQIDHRHETVQQMTAHLDRHGVTLPVPH